GEGPALWNNGTPKALPPNVFLICGDRAWQGIPRNAYGSPCYLGKLTLFAPHLSHLRNINRARAHRSIGLTPDCNNQLHLLSVAARVALSIFLPAGAAGNALKNIERLACWAEKQANVTTEVLKQLLVDQNSLRHALLQNRAAIDFLLLAKGHRCRDFEGMCCFNPSDHSLSIHEEIEWLKNHMSMIRKQTSWLDSWLGSIFGGVSGWVLDLIKEGLRCLCLILFILIVAHIGF
ncbi:ERB1 protein, partial [Eubucco bourcierii]|nr:ERB1 protein [Eubucco bourcierii]